MAESAFERCAFAKVVVDVLSLIGLGLAVISPVLAVYTLYQAQGVQAEAGRLRSRFLFRQRAVAFITNLAAAARLVSLQIKETASLPHELRSELEGCAVRIRGFGPKLEGEEATRQRSMRVRRRIENALQGKAVSKNDLQNVYAASRELSVATEELLEDRMLEVVP